MQGWRASTRATQDHWNRFPLLGAHAAVACETCHKGAASGVYTGLSTDCASCHLNDYNRAATLDHKAASLPTDCRSCHSVDTWRGAKFDHNRFTKFALLGAHQALQCASCHIGNKFQGVAADCFGCHAADFARASNPNHVAAGFPHECSTCHTSATWQGAKFDHNTLTKFALTGKHINTACTQCHVGGTFKGTPAACSGCHLGDYDKTVNPNHRQSSFSQQCETCHTTAQWQGAKFDHSLSRFPLTGKHTSVTCTSCHVNNQFSGTPLNCESCHLKDYQTAKSVDHTASGFPRTCETCHTTAQWQGAKFDHAATRFPLTGKHTAVACATCHVNNQFKGIGASCESCHLKDYQSAKSVNHVTSGFPRTCETCHTTTQWQGAKFDHAATKFPLTGKHTSVSCTTCHVNNQFAGLGAECVSCHLKDWQGTKNPNHQSSGFSQNCQSCHTTTQWLGAKFDHAATKFPLTGKHTAVACATCHVNNQFAGLATNCVSCHIKDYQGAKSVNHVASGFPQTCETCHTTTQWQGATFNHNTTKFPLTGKHTAVSCTTCHVNNQFAGLGTNCVSCHLKDYQGAKSVNHVASGFSQNCETCHTTTQWQGAAFNHAATKFPLTGKHTSVACATCHINNQFAGLPSSCVSCHLNDYQTAKSINHVTSGFPQTCETCHTTTQWQGAKFDHTTTRFPLTGKHTAVVCTSCHVNNVFKGTAMSCEGCHLPDFQKTTNPNHVTAGFSQSCALCHTTAQWQGAAFDHSTATKFPLTGKHTTVTCASCHVNNVFKGTATACEGCHLKDYQAAKSPNHVTSAFPQTCALCHTTAQWQGAKFDHNTTKFPLTGKHVPVACASCHVNNVYAGLGTACVNCHLPAFQKTTNPNHAQAGFPQDCSLCHQTAGWTPASFNHSTTKFPLTGKHVGVGCATCHVNNKYAGLGTACVNCHLNVYNSSKNPAHLAGGYPTTCELCHSTNAWTPSSFNHSTTKFPLTGKHVTTQCALCHVGGKFAGTPTDCYTCHTTEYNTTTNPNHVAAGFPKTCTTCHSTTTWSGATFNHTWFPTNHGRANGVCATCHTNSSDYKVFTCTNCHLKTQTDNEHRGRNNYVYNSINCYQCHPRGND
ncbi:MAG: hypothetical protein ABL967_05945 [Bryobacteraceae bacterium]